MAFLRTENSINYYYCNENKNGMTGSNNLICVWGSIIFVNRSLEKEKETNRNQEEAQWRAISCCCLLYFSSLYFNFNFNVIGFFSNDAHIFFKLFAIFKLTKRSQFISIEFINSQTAKWFSLTSASLQVFFCGANSRYNRPFVTSIVFGIGTMKKRPMHLCALRYLYMSKKYIYNSRTGD